METLGQLLKREREFRGLSREQLGRSTRMSQSVLSILEDDLPVASHQAIYLRSSLKNYARQMGLDAGELLSRFQTERGNEPVTVTPIATAQSSQGGSKAALIVFIVAVFITIVIYLARR